MLERRRQAVMGLEARRARLAAHLERCLASVGQVRLVLETAGPAGLGGAIEQIGSARRTLEDRAQESFG